MPKKKKTNCAKLGTNIFLETHSSYSQGSFKHHARLSFIIGHFVSQKMSKKLCLCNSPVKGVPSTEVNKLISFFQFVKILLH